MAVRRLPSKNASTKKQFKKSTPAIGSLSLSLPKERSVPENLFSAYSTLLYGERKIGKTTMIQHFPDIFMQMFEPGSKSLRAFWRPAPTWEHFLEYLRLMEVEQRKGILTFKNISLDTGAIAYERNLEYVCRLRGVDHPGGLNDYGQTWAAVASEFERAFNRIFALGLGLVVTAHESLTKIESMSGDEFTRIEPELKKQANGYLTGVIDNIFYYHYIGGDRFLTIRGNELIAAGTRCEENFLTPDGRQIVRIPMGNSSKESYDNLINAFNNKQEETYEHLLTPQEAAKLSAEEADRKSETLRKKKGSSRVTSTFKKKKR